MTRTLGSSDLALRLVPFIASVASLFVFFAIARRLLSPAGVLAALLFFAVGYWPLVYAADVHPYGLDLALSLGALLLALDVRRLGFPARRVWAFAAFGAVAMWCSNATVITLFGLGLALGTIAWRERGLTAALRTLWPVAGVAGTSAAAAVWVAKHSFFPAAAVYFDWLYRGGMVPGAALARCAALAVGRVALPARVIARLGDRQPAWTSLYVALALIGFLSLIRRRAADAIIVGSVVARSSSYRWRNSTRTRRGCCSRRSRYSWFGVGESVGVLANADWGRGRVIARSLALLLCIPPVYHAVAYPPPYQWTVTGAYLAQIRERWQPGDVVYSTYGRAPEVLYSAPRFGLAATDVILGPCNHEDPRATLRAADALRGRRRAWVIVESGRYFSGSPEYAYLRAIGRQRDSLPIRLPGSVRVWKPTPFDISTAYLFDLTDTTRLARATAESYTISPLLRPQLARMNEWSCYGVWSPLVRESASVGNRE